MADYLKFKKLTERLIAANGRAVSVQFKTGSNASVAAQPWRGLDKSTLPDPMSLMAVAFSPEAAQAFAKKQYGTSFEFNETSSRVFRVLMISPFTRPDYNDVISVEDLGVTYGVAGVHEFMPGTVSIFAFLGLKR